MNQTYEYVHQSNNAKAQIMTVYWVCYTDKLKKYGTKTENLTSEKLYTGYFFKDQVPKTVRDGFVPIEKSDPVEMCLSVLKRAPKQINSSNEFCITVEAEEFNSMMTAIEIFQDTTFTIDQVGPRINNTQLKSYHCVFGGRKRPADDSEPSRKKLKPGKKDDQCPFYFRVQEDFDTSSFKFFIKHKHICKCDRNKRILRRKIRSDILQLVFRDFW